MVQEINCLCFVAVVFGFFCGLLGFLGGFCVFGWFLFGALLFWFVVFGFCFCCGLVSACLAGCFFVSLI